jgi:signal transduction histidine kinase
VDESLRSDADGPTPQVERGCSPEAEVRRAEEHAVVQERFAAFPAGAPPHPLAMLGLPILAPPLSGELGSYFTAIARGLVRSVADGCTIDVVTPEGVLPCAIAHTDPTLEPALRDIARRDLSRIGQGSLLRVPLAASTQPLGVLTLWSERGRTLDPSELASVRWLARLLSLLLDHRRLERTAEEATKASESLLSMVSHEIRTPLATISMSLDTSMRRIQDSADELPKSWLLQRLEKAKKAVLRTDRLLHTFLGVSMIQLGRLVPDPQDVDATLVVTAVFNHLADDLAWAGCTCTLHAAGPERGTWDPVQLEIVLTNLLTNAIKYAPGSDVDVRVQGEPAHVSITVEDHGPGIAPEHQARLFQRYSRVPSSVRVHGFGLGLWIVKHFVEANGGSVQLSSALGRGTRFVLRLPRSGARG